KRAYARQSILSNKSASVRWMPGSSPGMTNRGQRLLGSIELDARRFDHLAPAPALGRDVGGEFIRGGRRGLGADVLERRDDVLQSPNLFYLRGDLVDDRSRRAGGRK